jgi:putative transposase
VEASGLQPVRRKRFSGALARLPIDLVTIKAYNQDMKLTLQTQLLPERDHSNRLKATVERFNEAANWLAGEAFDIKVSNKIDLQKTYYKELRERFGLSAQMTVRCIAQVCEAYKRDKTIRPVFRPLAAIPFDQRMMSFKGADRVSLLTLAGRILVPVIMGKYQAEKFTNAKGQADLVLRDDGKWFLLVTVDVPESAPIPSTDFLGVDLGIANLATDSDGKFYSGKPVEDVRRSHNLQRKRLQRKGTKGAKKKLKRVAKKEARFRKHENHCISKAIVETAIGTGRGIAVEDLTHIRDQITARGGDARNRLSGWSFGQLVAFLSYKAQRAGVIFMKVDPAYTSQTCPECSHRERANRKNQSQFRCKSCGHEQHADVVGARNIRNAALSEDRALAGRNPVHRTGQP